ncbi:hypothetical protein RN001_015403 [Aquatica leii]|uniref:Uncharacterized protein n=1 Tax=Aquatica leii TaxID=1421715 RepID=A0AAN7SDA9_9COLE|nr:hypothetical protein RN001_015403 [Aquatica leii]
MEKFEQGRVSENEDDPDVYESSGDEWNEEVEEKTGRNRRSSQRLSKKPRVTHAEVSSDSDGDGKKKKSKNGIKRQKLDPEQQQKEELEEEEEEEDIEEEEEEDEDESADSQTNNKTSTKKSTSKGSDFVNGSFLILKKDAEAGNKNLCLWRIDGKALLQKYESFEEDGQVRHRNTSIYTGWSSLDKDLYYPVVVKVLRHQGQNMTIELNWEKLKEMHNESE